GYQALRAKISSGKGKSPRPVVDRIIRAAGASKPALRQRVGQDAVMTALFQFLVPESLRIFLFRRVFPKLLSS
ncbi:MAG: hypothetical protein VX834_13775, partial [Myxococcota bacterium]|nr:hypothetical protein [Myxococcota bacterium]